MSFDATASQIKFLTVKVGNESDTQGLSGGSKLKVTDAQRLQSSLMLTGDENVIDMQFVASCIVEEVIHQVDVKFTHHIKL